MEIKIDTTIHNRFDIEVRDSASGKLKQEATAYNIIVNGMWNKVVGLGSYLDYIRFGEGTGTPAVTDTAMFTPLGSKPAVLVSSVVGYPTSYCKKKIVLAPEEYVGKVISEVGAAGHPDSLTSHAMLQDSEGNPITITKTALDIITIYATIYGTVSVDAPLSLTGFPTGNSLANYFANAGWTGYNMSLIVGSSDVPPHLNQGAGLLSACVGEHLGVIDMYNWIGDVPNKRMSSPVVRFAVTQANGLIREVCLGSVFRVVLPNSDIINGMQYEGVVVGTGNGSNKVFELPSLDISQGSIVVKKDGAATSAYTKELIPGKNYRRNGSYNGAVYLIEGRSGKAYTCTIGQLNYGSFIDGYFVNKGGFSLPGVSFGSYHTFGIRHSLADDILAVPLTIAPYVMLYDTSGDVPVPIPSPFDVAPTVPVRHVAWSPDGQHLILWGAEMCAYKKSGVSFTKMAMPAVPLRSGSNTFGAYYSPNGEYLTVSCMTYDGTQTAIMKRSGDTYTKMTGFDISKYSLGAPIWDATYTKMLLFTDTSMATIYSVSGTVLTPITTWTHGHGDLCFTCRLNDGTLALVSGVAPYIFLHRWDETDDTFTEITKSTVITGISPPSAGADYSAEHGILWTQKGNELPCQVDVKPRTTRITFDTAPASGVAITADYMVNGIHKTDQYVIDLSTTIQFGEPA